jgi:hypothetical protein
MKEKIAEKRGRFLVQELDEDQLNVRCRHYSLLNFKGAQHLFLNDISENLENNNDPNIQILHTSYVFDFKRGKFVDFETTWQIFSKNLRKETEDMNIIFNYSTVDNFHSHSHTDDTLSDLDAITSSHQRVSYTEDNLEFNEYSELGHSNVFVMNPNCSDLQIQRDH